MSERFQTVFTRLRPHRIAILTNVDDPMWQETCVSILEFLSQVWGGYHSLIIPTNGKTIDTVFWKLLSAFDPDAIYVCVRTLRDVKRWAAAEADAKMEAELAKIRAEDHDHIDEDGLREQMLQWPTANFTISPELTKELLDRLSPFHFQDFFNVLPVRMGDAPGVNLTKVADVVPYVQSPDALFVLFDNLTAPRQAPPFLWLRAESGIASDRFQKDLSEAGVTSVPKYMNTETDGTIIGWGIEPWVNLGANAPFSFARLALATVRSRQAHPFAVPNVIVRGDTLKDFCLYYAISRNNGRVLWLPKWFLPAANEFPANLIAAVRKHERIGRDHHCDYFSLVSMSEATDELRTLEALVRKHMSSLSLNIDDGNDPHYLDRMLKYPAKVYIKKNIDRITTHQIVDDKLPGYFESPVPAIFSEIVANKHRWVGEISFVGHPIPRHRDLGRRVIEGNMYEARAGIDGVAYPCPGALLMGDDIELQMVRFSVSVPSSDSIFQAVFSECGYNSIVSDKGAYASESTKKFGGLHQIVAVLRNPQKKSLLMKFMDDSENKQGVRDQGTFLTDDRRRYLDFGPMSVLLGGDDAAAALIDEWIERQILYRGFIFKCARCSNTAWFSVGDLAQEFKCHRCGTLQQYKQQHLIDSKEPRWQYKLDEIIFQLLKHDGEVGLLTVDALRRQSTGNFIYSPEHKLRLEADPKQNMEIDICCIMDNQIIIGEAKSSNSLKANGKKPTQVTAKYEHLAKAMNASSIIFSTTEPEWDEPSRKAIDHLKKHNPLLQIYDYRHEQLYPKK